MRKAFLIPIFLTLCCFAGTAIASLGNGTIDTTNNGNKYASFLDAFNLGDRQVNFGKFSALPQ